MTLREAYEYGQERLKSVGIEEFFIDAWHLLEFVTGIDRTAYFLEMSEEISEEQRERYESCLEQRMGHIPLQHITGVQEFMGLEFSVNEHVLVPRQDTEVLVESVLSYLQPRMNVLDMCTGSGCILISLMKLGKITRGTGVDISEDALCVARANAKRHQVEPLWIKSDLFDNVVDKYDVIVSNPPYIRTAVIEELKEEVKFHDPLLALDGKEDGLYFYRKLVEESPVYLKKGGMLYFEIGHDQGQAVKDMMESAGFECVTVKKDLAGLDRVVFGVYNIAEGSSDEKLYCDKRMPLFAGR